MRGWRLRIGLILPSSNTTMEPEFYCHVPMGVTVHASRMFLVNATPDELARMADEAERCAKLLKTAEVDVIVYGCTSGSFLKGKGFDEDLEARIEKEADVPAITTSRAVIKALQETNLKRLGIATPYVDEVNEREIQYFIEYGFEVKALRGLGIRRGFDIGKRDPSEAYRLGLEVMREAPDADGLFISCTQFRTFEIIELLTHDIGKSVITSNQASLWMALKLGGVKSFLYGLEK